MTVMTVMSIRVFMLLTLRYSWKMAQIVGSLDGRDKIKLSVRGSKFLERSLLI